MAIDPTIPLGIQVPQQPNMMQTVSSMLGVRQQQQAIQAKAIENQQSAIDLQETQRAQGLTKNIQNYQDSDGNIDLTKLGTDMAQVAPKNYAKFMSGIAQAQQAATLAKASWNQASSEQRSAIGSVAASLIDQDPSAAVKTWDAIMKAPAFSNMTPALVHMSDQVHQAASNGDKSAMNDVLRRVAAMSTPAASQQPNVAMVPTATGTQPYNTNGLAPGGVGPMGETITPPNQVISTTGGGAAMANPATGRTTPFQGNATVDFPQSETAQTQAELQAQRTGAQQAASTAPSMHNLNRSVIAEVDKGITTGKLGEIIQKVKSATGYAGDTGTDYNTLGKLLERSALTAAQGMGPHTNAGLEAQVRANGSTDYSPGAIRKIAALNDALTTGQTLYQSGLEGAVTTSPNGVFAKRQFDRQWADAMNPTNGVDGVQALRLKNAVDNGDASEKSAIIKEVGGAGSKGAQALLSKLRQLQQLSQGSQQ